MRAILLCALALALLIAVVGARVLTPPTGTGAASGHAWRP